VFDSTGLAVQDHAAVAMVFERARSMRDVTSIRLDDAPGVP
jgi:ornithine cyclodeaminase/alanine dehydrogenase-like protein (mu-crystallin family)